MRNGVWVKVIEGPFEGFEGVVDEVLPLGEVRITADIFGRKTPITIETWQVQVVDENQADGRPPNE